LGDVAGKGMPAALLTSMLQGIFAAQAPLDLPLPVLLSNANKNLAKRGIGNRFVTLFFGILDPDGGLTYTNAGHNPPLIVGRDGSFRELTEGGMVLGLFPQAEYEAKTVRLLPGDHLVLFTDGVVEARDRAGEEFGEERLRALLQAKARASAGDMLSTIGDAVMRFSADAPQHDDITMMVLGFQETHPSGPA
jgi:sigma-B regulation protein RsbU (phosphoserine phosphatase)